MASQSSEMTKLLMQTERIQDAIYAFSRLPLDVRKTFAVCQSCHQLKAHCSDIPLECTSCRGDKSAVSVILANPKKRASTDDAAHMAPEAKKAIHVIDMTNDAPLMDEVQKVDAGVPNFVNAYTIVEQEFEGDKLVCFQVTITPTDVQRALALYGNETHPRYEWAMDEHDMIAASKVENRRIFLVPLCRYADLYLRMSFDEPVAMRTAIFMAECFMRQPIDAVFQKDFMSQLDPVHDMMDINIINEAIVDPDAMRFDLLCSRTRIETIAILDSANVVLFSFGS